MSPTGDRLATTTSTGGVRLWNANTGKKIGDSELTGNGVAFSPDGTRSAVATAGRPGNVGMWDTGTGQQLRTFVGPTQASTRVRFSPDGRRVAAEDLTGPRGCRTSALAPLNSRWRTRAGSTRWRSARPEGRVDR